MRQWTGVVLLGMTTVAVWALPFSDDPVDPNAGLSPQTVRYRELMTESAIEREQIRRLDWLDSWTTTLRQGDGLPRVIVTPNRFNVDSIRALEERLRRELSVIPNPQADVVLTSSRLSLQLPGAAWRSAHDEYFVIESTGRPFCIRFMATFSAVRLNEQLLQGASEIAGSCAYLVRYGSPGPGVAQWLKAGSLARGTRRVVQRSTIELLYPTNGLLTPIGAATRALSLAAHHCLGGDTDSCVTIFLHPKPIADPVARELPKRLPELWGVTGGAQGATYHFGLAEGAMLADLEQEFGEARFRLFWTSDSEVTAAFESAFGVAPGVWIRDWAERYYAARSPLTAGLTHWAATIITLLAASIAVRRATETRRVA